MMNAACLRISESRRKLLGLDAPNRIETTGDQPVVVLKLKCGASDPPWNRLSSPPHEQ
jgi:hypothetical protein